MPYSFRNVSIAERLAVLAEEYQIASNICTLLIPLVEADTAISTEDKDATVRWLKEKQLHLQFQDICRDALAASNRKDFKLAAQEYTRAFELNVIRGTYSERINSLAAFTQTGNTEAAFKQLDLLANRFKLRGSESVVDDPLLEPLHKDKRWDKYMKILEENKKLKYE